MEYLIIFLPLLGAIASGLFGKYISDRFWEFLTSSFVSISAILSLIIFYEVIANDYTNNIEIFTWLTSGSLEISWAIQIDALSATMLVVVGLVSSLLVLQQSLSSTSPCARP